jgi:hypothetical protein
MTDVLNDLSRFLSAPAASVGMNEEDTRVADTPATRIVREGQHWINRAEMSLLCGLAKTTLSKLYRDRNRTGHPLPAYVDPVRGTLYFDEQATLRWYRAYRNTLPQ